MLPDSPNDHIPGYNAAFSQGRVIVIGAGFARLSTARLLKTKRYDVTVWEASDRLGDRVKTKHQFNKVTQSTDVYITRSGQEPFILDY